MKKDGRIFKQQAFWHFIKYIANNKQSLNIASNKSISGISPKTLQTTNILQATKHFLAFHQIHCKQQKLSIILSNTLQVAATTTTVSLRTFLPLSYCQINYKNEKNKIKFLEILYKQTKEVSK